MRILIVSDTHGKNQSLWNVLERVGKIDYLIHCGDLEGAEDEIRARAGCPCVLISGNNDWGCHLPGEVSFPICGKRFLITHGHTYGLYMGYERLRSQARQKKADIVLFGHTHTPYLDETMRPILANPGSLSYPRQSDRRGTYLILEISDDGELVFHQEKL